MVRIKNRWFLVEFITHFVGPHTSRSPSFDNKQVLAALRQSIISNFGDAGWGAIGLSLTVKYFSPTTNLCIIRVARDEHKLAWGAITLLTRINGVHIIPRVIHISGTIKHTQLAAIKHNREVIAHFRACAKTPASYHAHDSYERYLIQSTCDIKNLQE